MEEKIIITQSGIHIQKIGQPDQGTPTAFDIAVHSGRICRFGGCIWYPLLTHLVFVGLMAWRRTQSTSNLLWGFLHDAHEIATSDVPRPFKCECMRREQAAIDARIVERFFPENNFLLGEPDLAVVKQCDDDACDIEAVEFGVPGFSEIEMAYTKDYRGRTSIHSAHEDRMLLQRIRGSVFYGDTINGIHAKGVERFKTALALAEKRRYMDFEEEVLSWRLL
jgi:hypothetical protein